MDNTKVLRAEETWQKAGAFFVRIQGMNRQYHISLKEEFDEHDEESKYIVLLKDEYPVATCRFYEINSDSVMLGRVVVLPEYREQHLGKEVINEAAAWIKELGYKSIIIEARVEVVGFYEKLGFTMVDDEVIKSWNFDCRKMIKVID
ncbi:MAG: GNAT family N-acetyltransferase [Ruminococcus sp.]|nr:GNAT family N-acetyltransferase [Ruminococcus sp.]